MALRTVARGLDTIRIGDGNRMGRGRSASPSDDLRDAARATPPIVVTADALASPMSPTSMYHTATPNVSASCLGIGSAGAIQSSINTSKAALPGVMRGVTQFTIEELREEIRSTPELSNAPIGDLYRREIPSAFSMSLFWFGLLFRAARALGFASTGLRKGIGRGGESPQGTLLMTLYVTLSHLVDMIHSQLRLCWFRRE